MACTYGDHSKCQPCPSFDAQFLVSIAMCGCKGTSYYWLLRGIKYLLMYLLRMVSFFRFQEVLTPSRHQKEKLSKQECL